MQTTLTGTQAGTPVATVGYGPHAELGLPEEHTETPATDDSPVIMQVAIPLAHPHSTAPGQEQ